jgi:hypothetical protein
VKRRSIASALGMSIVIGITAWPGALRPLAAPLLRTSRRRFGKVASTAGADVLLSNHEKYIDLNKRLGAKRANPAGPNPLVLGSARVGNFMEVLDHCTQALAMASATRAAAAK